MAVNLGKFFSFVIPALSLANSIGSNLNKLRLAGMSKAQGWAL